MRNNNPTIGLYGIKGVYNYGCEAIVRGTDTILHDIWPDVTIKYASLRPNDDKKRLKGSTVKIIPRKECPLLSFSRFNRMLSTATGLYLENFYREDLTWVEDCDMIFLIGGDLYTFPINHKNRVIMPYYNYLIHFGNLVKKMNKKFIMWGSSIGPFENDLKARKVFVNHLNEVDLITSREPDTTAYLNNLGISKNVTSCADPAFVVPSTFNDNYLSIDKNELCIGLNLSPLSSEYAFGTSYGTSDVENHVKLISELVKNINANVVLLPHVICDFDIKDDDLTFLKFIYEQLPDDIKDHVILVNKDPGFIGIKEIIAQCNIVVAARMHCAINSISLGIPTILVAYSQKANGMSTYVYGNSKWKIPLQNMTPDKLLKLIKLMLLEKESINSYLNKKIEKIKLDAYLPSEKLKNMI